MVSDVFCRRELGDENFHVPLWRMGLLISHSAWFVEDGITPLLMVTVLCMGAGGWWLVSGSGCGGDEQLMLVAVIRGLCHHGLIYDIYGTQNGLRAWIILHYRHLSSHKGSRCRLDSAFNLDKLSIAFSILPLSPNQSSFLTASCTANATQMQMQMPLLCLIDGFETF